MLFRSVDTLQQFTMVKSGKRPAVQIDQMPAGATKRPMTPGKLPPGIAMITLLSGIAARKQGITDPFFVDPRRVDHGVPVR